MDKKYLNRYGLIAIVILFLLVIFSWGYVINSPSVFSVVTASIATFILLLYTCSPIHTRIIIDEKMFTLLNYGFFSEKIVCMIKISDIKHIVLSEVSVQRSGSQWHAYLLTNDGIYIQILHPDLENKIVKSQTSYLAEYMDKLVETKRDFIPSLEEIRKSNEYLKQMDYHRFDNQ